VAKNRYRYFQGLAYSVRDRLISLWIETQRAYYDAMVKRVYYLSMEFLPGRFLMNYLVNMRMDEATRPVVESLGFSLDDLEEQEWDAGLGNGGLGRLASCYMDSMATLRIPGYGYGIMYDYGIFHQTIVGGWQEEHCDNWRRHGSPWEIVRRENLYDVHFYGRTESYEDARGLMRRRWVDTQRVRAMPCDILIPGYDGEHVTNMRLWAAQSSEDFDLTDFNRGDYMGAMESKVVSENITKVLYPNDKVEQGRELRLKQQYFMVAATFQDIMRRHMKLHGAMARFPDYVAVQLNDTHPAIAIPELMRLLLDEHALGWDEAWGICTRTFAYTNHTVLPEALETWPVDLLGRLLPRHLEIIYEINRRFLDDVAARFPGDGERLARMSLIGEGHVRTVRMANLAIVGSHTVNGRGRAAFGNPQERPVQRLPPALAGQADQRDQRRHAPALAAPGQPALVGAHHRGHRPRLGHGPGAPARTGASGRGLRVPHALGPGQAGQQEALCALRAAQGQHGREPQDHVRRAGQADARIQTPASERHARGGAIQPHPRGPRGAPHSAHGVLRRQGRPRLPAGQAHHPAHQRRGRHGELRPRVRACCAWRFLPNYCFSQAEKIIRPPTSRSRYPRRAWRPRARAIEVRHERRPDHRHPGRRQRGDHGGGRRAEHFHLRAYGPRGGNHAPGRLQPPRILRPRPRTAPRAGHDRHRGLSAGSPHLFRPLVDSLLEHGDWYMLLADFRDYVDTQRRVDRLFDDPDAWTRTSILNTANMGKFSSDRSVREYAERIWNAPPLGR
jgi:starch phosphorylase